MKALGRLKVVAAVVLAASLALPMSSCTHYVSPSGQLVGFLGFGPPRPDSRAIVDHEYVLSAFSPEHPGNWVIVLAYLWPLLMLGYRPRAKRGVISRAIWWVQAPLLVASGVLVWFVASWGAPAVGAYVASGALLLYAFAWLAGGIIESRSGPHGREPNDGVHPTACAVGSGATSTGEFGARRG